MNNSVDILKDLAQDYYLRDLTDRELTQLQDGLKQHADLRDFFMNAAADEWLIHHVTHIQSLTTIKLRPMTHRPMTHRRTFLQLAASVIILLTIGTLFYGHKTGWDLPQLTRVTQSPIVAKVTAFYVVDPDAISALNNGSVRLVKQASFLHAGDRVVIPPGGRLTFKYVNEGTTVQFSGESLFTLTERDGAKHIQLSQGQIVADVDEQPIGKPMRITTDDAEAVVLGTTFELSAGNVTRLAVHKGCVQFNSQDEHHSVEVPSGFLAESDRDKEWERLPFSDSTVRPEIDGTIGLDNNPAYICVDHLRKYYGYLKFDLGRCEGDVIEARLKLRVTKKGSDYGGSGIIRLLTLPADQIPAHPSVDTSQQIAFYEGKVGVGMDLIFKLDPAQLNEGKNAFLIVQDPGGNDFWFSSSEGNDCPELSFKVDRHNTPPVR